jgi:hypothetical protein
VALQDTSFPEESNEGPVTGYLTGSQQRHAAAGYPVRVPGDRPGLRHGAGLHHRGRADAGVFDGPTGPQMVLNMGLAQANLLDLRSRS